MILSLNLLNIFNKNNLNKNENFCKIGEGNIKNSVFWVENELKDTIFYEIKTQSLLYVNI